MTLSTTCIWLPAPVSYIRQVGFVVRGWYLPISCCCGCTTVKCSFTPIHSRQIFHLEWQEIKKWIIYYTSKHSIPVLLTNRYFHTTKHSTSILLTNSYFHTSKHSIPVLLTNRYFHTSKHSIQVLLNNSYLHTSKHSIPVLLTNGYFHTSKHSIPVLLTNGYFHTSKHSIPVLLTKGRLRKAAQFQQTQNAKSQHTYQLLILYIQLGHY